MRPVKFFLGLIVGLALLMFVVKVLLFAALLAIPAALLFFAAKGIRQSFMEGRSDQRYGDQFHYLDSPLRGGRYAEPLFKEREKSFDWYGQNRSIQVS